MLQDWEEARGEYCHHYPICIRKIVADQTLISMASEIDVENDLRRTDSREPEEENAAAWYSVSLISYQHPSQRDSFSAFTKILAACVVEHFDARLHWGKYFPLPESTAQNSYPAMTRFHSIRQAYDPTGRFCNDWTSKLFANRSVPNHQRSTAT